MAKSTEKLARVTRIELGLAKTVFQVHGVDAKGEIVIARKLRRGAMLEFFGRLAPCVVAMIRLGRPRSKMLQHRFFHPVRIYDRIRGSDLDHKIIIVSYPPRGGDKQRWTKFN
jgi:hypothetical protein